MWGESGDGVRDVRDLLVSVGAALVPHVDLERVGARGRRRPAEGVAGAVGLDHRPAAARGLDPELVGGGAGAGGGGGERDQGAVRAAAGRVGGEPGGAAAVDHVGAVGDHVVDGGLGGVADVDLEAVAAGQAGLGPGVGGGGAVVLDHAPAAAGISDPEAIAGVGAGGAAPGQGDGDPGAAGRGGYLGEHGRGAGGRGLQDVGGVGDDVIDGRLGGVADVDLEAVAAGDDGRVPGEGGH